MNEENFEHPPVVSARIKPSYRVVMSPSFSVAEHGRPPGAFKRWLIRKLFGWRIELIPT